MRIVLISFTTPQTRIKPRFTPYFFAFQTNVLKYSLCKMTVKSHSGTSGSSIRTPSDNALPYLAAISSGV